jgi:hypothetical protein
MTSFYFTTDTFLGAPSSWKSLIAKKFFNKKCLFYHVPQSSARSFAYRHNWRWLIYTAHCQYFFYSISLSKYAEGPKYPACILNLLFVNLKGPLHEIFYPRPLIHGLIPFWIWIRIREENRLLNRRFWSQRWQWHRCDQKQSLVNPHIFCVKAINIL